MICPAEEGIHSLRLGNAMLFSALSGRRIEIPFDDKEYEALLQGLIENSNFKKNTGESAVADLGSSY